MKNIKQLAIKNLEHLLQISTVTCCDLVQKRLNQTDAKQINNIKKVIDELKHRSHHYQAKLRHLLQLPDNCKFKLKGYNYKAKEYTLNQLFYNSKLGINDHEHMGADIGEYNKYKLIISYDDLQYKDDYMSINPGQLSKKISDRYEKEINQIMIDQANKKKPKANENKAKLPQQLAEAMLSGPLIKKKLSDKLQKEYNEIKDEMEKLSKKDLKYSREKIVKAIEIDVKNINQYFKQLRQSYSELQNEMKKLNKNNEYYNNLLKYLSEDKVVKAVIEE